MGRIFIYSFEWRKSILGWLFKPFYCGPFFCRIRYLCVFGFYDIYEYIFVSTLTFTSVVQETLSFGPKYHKRRETPNLLRCYWMKFSGCTMVTSVYMLFYDNMSQRLNVYMLSVLIGVLTSIIWHHFINPSVLKTSIGNKNVYHIYQHPKILNSNSYGHKLFVEYL